MEPKIVTADFPVKDFDQRTIAVKPPKLRFNTADASMPPVALPGDPEVALQRALDHGWMSIEVDWDGLFVVDLFVEDDVMFLVQAANQLAESGDATRHYVFLGDGLLVVETEFEDENARMTVDYTPHLDKRFTEQATKVIPRHNYIAAWRRLAAQLWRALPPPGSSDSKAAPPQ